MNQPVVHVAINKQIVVNTQQFLNSLPLAGQESVARHLISEALAGVLNGNPNGTPGSDQGQNSGLIED